ncbi:helix-turn-helix domain-containing protein [Photobacterium carnosum]|uniref:helix-turn-helix domain-containing protein n=1 Tax=Photobacterium carnosum TaxID=2023717 RepID=UPI001C919CC0|nr:helix-turn-helix domain-containing protein [Photobacterium carnosum]MBY3790708.1 helix-turn-helix domain-containing protein [Photobacterium carnosum]
MIKVPASQYELTSMLIQSSTPDLKSLEKLLLIVLSDFGNEKGEDIYPSLSTLSDKTCMTRRSVINNLKSLEGKGYIAKFTGGVVDGKNVTNRYFINLEKFGYDYDKKGNVIAAASAS